ncbi:MAG: PepSY domain-containing protein [Maricaulaceae bacterium]
MKPQKLLRQVHHWGSLVIMVQMGLVIGAGLLLMLKKEFDWIQPPTQKGVERAAVPSLSLAEMWAEVSALEAFEGVAWADLDRVDVKPDKGVVKFVAPNRWEAQIDATTGEIVQLAYRRSDLIEQLHDGSFFADWVKLYVFLPTGVGLLILWASGIYLFILPHAKRYRRARTKQSKRTVSA